MSSTRHVWSMVTSSAAGDQLSETSRHLWLPVCYRVIAFQLWSRQPKPHGDPRTQEEGVPLRTRDESKTSSNVKVTQWAVTCNKDKADLKHHVSLTLGGVLSEEHKSLIICSHFLFFSHSRQLIGQTGLYSYIYISFPCWLCSPKLLNLALNSISITGCSHINSFWTMNAILL